MIERQVIKLNEESKEKNHGKKLAEEIKDELKKLKPIQCKGNIFEAFRAERSTALRLAHKLLKSENKPFSIASKEIWKQIREQRRTCELEEPVEEEQDVDATIEERPEAPLSEQTAVKEPSEEKPEELPNA